MKLYGFPPSPNTWKVRAVAAQIGVPLDTEFVDLTKPRSPDYLAINPTGRTPTLVDGDFKLWESNAIMQYVVSRTSNALWPNDARLRAEIMGWQSWQLAHWSKEGCEPLIFQRLVKKLLNLGPPDEAILAKGTECFNREARVLDAHPELVVLDVLEPRRLSRGGDDVVHVADRVDEPERLGLIRRVDAPVREGAHALLEYLAVLHDEPDEAAVHLVDHRLEDGALLGGELAER